MDNLQIAVTLISGLYGLWALQSIAFWIKLTRLETHLTDHIIMSDAQSQKMRDTEDRERDLTERVTRIEASQHRQQEAGGEQ